uniref:uncharacterized protein LOC122598629 n=1 Tax=Erigeron canadensis TaxID=72917 RepID=UPI001CB9A744|nr:uncharacterized protein LOC122598629 [Erigeron canadensis]
MMNSKKSMEANNNNLKEALCLQQRLLQKLYNELDVERESAATAASEAMSMILRLQGEKAAVKMEAEQYKRLAEEKMNHAEESMEIFEEIMYQKEMEISSLDYQVQAYRYKLLSLGFDDLGANEVKYPEHLLQRNESLGETSNKNTPKRLKLPNLRRGTLERDRSITEDPDVIAKIVEESLHDDENNQNLDLGLGWKADGSSSVDINSYLEQIRKLDKVVEDMVGEQFSCPNGITSRCSSTPSKLNEMDLVQCPKKLMDDKIVSSDTCSPGVHDVFEVPLVDETLYKDDEKSNFKDDERVKKLAPIPPSPEESYYKDELDLLKKPLLSQQKEKKVFLPKDGINVNCHMALVQPTTYASKTQEASQQTYMATEITEGETKVVQPNARQEPFNTRSEQELRLLYEINGKLDSIQSEIRSRLTKINKSSPNCDMSMIQLKEAMSEFWF